MATGWVQQLDRGVASERDSGAGYFTGAPGIITSTLVTPEILGRFMVAYDGYQVEKKDVNFAACGRGDVSGFTAVSEGFANVQRWGFSPAFTTALMSLGDDADVRGQRLLIENALVATQLTTRDSIGGIARIADVADAVASSTTTAKASGNIPLGVAADAIEIAGSDYAKMVSCEQQTQAELAYRFTKIGLNPKVKTRFAVAKVTPERPLHLFVSDGRVVAFRSETGIAEQEATTTPGYLSIDGDIAEKLGITEVYEDVLDDSKKPDTTQRVRGKAYRGNNGTVEIDPYYTNDVLLKAYTETRRQRDTYSVPEKQPFMGGNVSQMPIAYVKVSTGSKDDIHNIKVAQALISACNLKGIKIAGLSDGEVAFIVSAHESKDLSSAVEMIKGLQTLDELAKLLQLQVKGGASFGNVWYGGINGDRDAFGNQLNRMARVTYNPALSAGIYITSELVEAAAREGKGLELEKPHLIKAKGIEGSLTCYSLPPTLETLPFAEGLETLEIKDLILEVDRRLAGMRYSSANRAAVMRTLLLYCGYEINEQHSETQQVSGSRKWRNVLRSIDLNSITSEQEEGMRVLSIIALAQASKKDDISGIISEMTRYTPQLSYTRSLVSRLFPSHIKIMKLAASCTFGRVFRIRRATIDNLLDNDDRDIFKELADPNGLGLIQIHMTPHGEEISLKPPLAAYFDAMTHPREKLEHHENITDFLFSELRRMRINGETETPLYYQRLRSCALHAMYVENLETYTDLQDVIIEALDRAWQDEEYDDIFMILSSVDQLRDPKLVLYCAYSHLVLGEPRTALELLSNPILLEQGTPEQLEQAKLYGVLAEMKVKQKHNHEGKAAYLQDLRNLDQSLLGDREKLLLLENIAETAGYLNEFESDQLAKLSGIDLRETRAVPLDVESTDTRMRAFLVQVGMLNNKSLGEVQLRRPLQVAVQSLLEAVQPLVTSVQQKALLFALSLDVYDRIELTKPELTQMMKRLTTSGRANQTLRKRVKSIVVNPVEHRQYIAA